MQEATTDVFNLLPPDGEMADLIRRKDWAQTPLGPPQHWPQSLRTTLGTMLACPFPMFLWWGPTLIQLYNDAYRLILGNPGKHPAALGQAGADCWPELWPVIGPLIDAVRHEGHSVRQENSSFSIHRNGLMEDIYATFSYSPVRDDTGQIAGVLVVCQETTAQMATDRVRQERIVQSAARWNYIFAQAPVAICILQGPTFIIDLANDEQLKMWDRLGQNLLGQPFFEALPEVKGQGFEAILTGVLTTGEPVYATERPARLIRNGKQETAWFNFIHQALRNDTGQIVGVVSVANEVTEQVLARQQVAQSELRLRSIIANTPAAMGLLVGRDLVIELPNQPFINSVGKGPDIEGKPLREVMPELISENQPFLQILDDVYTSGKPYQEFGSHAKILRNGVLTDGYYNISYTPLLDATGQVYAILDTGIDVTEQIRAQTELADQRTYLQNAIAVADLGTFSVDLIGNVATFSETVRNWFGLPTTREPMELIFSQIHPEDLPQVQKTIGAAIESEAHSTHDLVYRVVDPAGDGDLYMRSFGKALYENGVAQTLIGVLQNVTPQVTARRKLETSESQYRLLAEELDARVKQRTQELERSNLDLLRFASVASHDLKEPIRKVQTFGNLLQESLADRLTNDEADLFRRMTNSAARMQALVNDVLRLSKLSDITAAFMPVDLNAVLEQIQDDLELIIREQNAEIVAGTLPTVRAEPAQMHQLMLNLVSNALKFQDNPTPRIRVEVVPITEALLDELGLPDSQQYAVVAVSDNGIGFDPQYKDRIFGMFQRLHGRSQYPGTGMGLTIVKKIVENHQGYIDVQSQPGVGTTFRVALPVV